MKANKQMCLRLHKELVSYCKSQKVTAGEISASTGVPASQVHLILGGNIIQYNNFQTIDTWLRGKLANTEGK